MRAVGKVIVVDDDAEARAALVARFTADGWAVTELPDLRNLPSVLAATRPDVLVLDLVLPREDGMDVAFHLRDAGSTLPILLISATLDPAHVALMEELTRDLGLQGFVPKAPGFEVVVVAQARALLPLDRGA